MKIGKNAEENTQLFKEAHQDDWWFHLDSFPSAHVYVSELTPENIQLAAETIKEKSKFKNLKNVKVVYTQKRNLRLGDKPGLVIIQSNRKCRFIYV